MSPSAVTNGNVSAHLSLFPPFMTTANYKKEEQRWILNKQPSKCFSLKETRDVCLWNTYLVMVPSMSEMITLSSQFQR